MAASGDVKEIKKQSRRLKIRSRTNLNGGDLVRSTSLVLILTFIFMILNSPVRPDETFIDMLKQNCCLSGPHFPPPAIVEALQDYDTHYHKVRRLHLIVVDLWWPWKYNTARAKDTDQLWRISHNDDTRRVSPFRPDDHSGADDLYMDMRSMALNAQATWSGSKRRAILYSVGYLHNGHTCFGSKLFSSLGHATLLSLCERILGWLL